MKVENISGQPSTTTYRATGVNLTGAGSLFPISKILPVRD
jgi:hypothetical protein